MKPKRLHLSEQIRRAVDASDRSRYRIAKEAGIDQSAFSRFMAGKVGLLQQNLDRLADVLGLDVVARGPAKVLSRERPGPKPKKGR